jgi:hypothetical protein
MSRELPQFYMFLQSHDIVFFYETRKKEEIKRELFLHKREVLVLVCSLEVWKHLQAHTLGCLPTPPNSPLKRTHLYWNLPYNIMGFSI